MNMLEMIETFSLLVDSSRKKKRVAKLKNSKEVKLNNTRQYKMEREWKFEKVVKRSYKERVNSHIHTHAPLL